MLYYFFLLFVYKFMDNNNNDILGIRNTTVTKEFTHMGVLTINET